MLNLFESDTCISKRLANYFGDSAQSENARDLGNLKIILMQRLGKPCNAMPIKTLTHNNFTCRLRIMGKKLTLNVSDAFYEGLYAIAGKRNISHFIESALSSQVIQADIDRGYAEMAKDEQQENEANIWCESLIEDFES